MRRKNWNRWLPFLLCLLAPLPPSVASADTAKAGRTNAPDAASLSDRIDRLEARLLAVEAEVAQLRGEKQSAERDVERQKKETAGLKSEMARGVAASASNPSAKPQTDADNGPLVPTTQLGARLGYQGFPYGQKEGGFFYGFFFDHRLFEQSEEPTFGDLDAEIGIGIARSGSDHLLVNSAVLNEFVNIEYRQTMLSFWPSLKYHFDPWARMGIRPYIVGGPGIWGDIIESPPLYVGQAPAAKQFAERKAPVDGAAGIFEGGQGGAGIELSLARTGVPILQHMNLGFDYRYSAFTSGQRFNTYSFSLSSGE